MHHAVRILIASLACAALLISAAQAQDAQPAEVAPPAQVQPTDPEIDALIERLVGSYQAEEHRLHIVEVVSPPFERPLYVELARHGFETTPDRQQLWWVYRHEGRLRIRVNIFPERQTFHFATSPADLAVGMWAAPDYFPRLDADMYDALGDLTVEQTGDGVTLSSDSPFPIQFGGALFAEAEIAVDANGLDWTEVGRNAAGEVEWGGETIAMTRLESTPKAIELERGVRIIELREGEGEEVVEGRKVALHYEGWLTNGILIDSTKVEGRQILVETFPVPLMDGFNIGLRGMRAPESPKNAKQFASGVRRVLAPPAVAFGDRGAPPIVPPGMPIVFNIELRSVLPNRAADGAAPPGGQ